MTIKNKNGFTIIEAIIAMLLVAVVVGGVFGALMMARRAIIEPSYKEEILYSVESVKNILKSTLSGAASDGVGTGPCGGSNPLAATGGQTNLLGTGCNVIPSVCGDGSTYFYKVSDSTVTDDLNPGFEAFTVKRLHIYMDCQRQVL